MTCKVCEYVSGHSVSTYMYACHVSSRTEYVSYNRHIRQNV